MDRLQRNAGTMGVLAAVFLAVLFLLLLSSGLDFQAMNDPSKALPAYSLSPGRWAAAGIAGILGSAFALVFTGGLYVRLRSGAPTRAVTVLLLAVLGSTGFALASLLQWLGGQQLAARLSTDQVAATHAYIALTAVIQASLGLGNAFVGAALIIAGWAISATKALSAGVGWIAYLGGILTILLVLAPLSSFLNLASLVLIIIWLAWAGVELRR